MFSVEIRVNGTVAGVAHVQNLGRVQHNAPTGVYWYNWEYHRMPYDGHDGRCVRGRLTFAAAGGIERLSTEILTSAIELLKETNR